MFSVHHNGDFAQTYRLLKLASSRAYLAKLEGLGAKGVKALSNATPLLTGEAANSWGYTIKRSFSSVSIEWTNDDYAGSAPLVVLLQYGHGTRNGGYVEGQDFINPAIKPVFDEIAHEAWALLKK